MDICIAGTLREKLLLLPFAFYSCFSPVGRSRTLNLSSAPLRPTGGPRQLTAMCVYNLVFVFHFHKI